MSLAKGGERLIAELIGGAQSVVKERTVSEADKMPNRDLS